MPEPRSAPEPTPAPQPDPWIPDGIMNYRDLGGLPVRGGGSIAYGRLLRSATPQLLTVDDLTWLTSHIGLRTVIDLRFSGESRAEGSGLLTDSGVQLVNLPFVIERPATPDAAVPDLDDAGRATLYLDMIDRSAEPIRQAVSLMADGGTPVLFHCAAGKDRTGILAALVLSAVGVSDDQVVADYARTNEHLPALLEQLRSLASYADREHLADPARNQANATVMQAFLEGLHERHGSAADYLQSAGVGTDALQRLRDALVLP